MFLVRYRCKYRDVYYDDLETPNPQFAIQRASEIAWQRNTPVIIEQFGQVVWVFDPRSQR